MSNKAPGLSNQNQIRSNARLFGIILTVLGAAGVIGGAIGFVGTGFDSSYDPFAEDGVPRPVIWMGVFLLGGILLGFGRSLLVAGYGGVALQYAAGEAAPVIKETKEYLTADDAAAPGGSGPFCRSCGVRNDAEARFCDACGASLT